MKTTIKNINLSLKGFLTISDAYTLPTVTGGLGDIMMSNGSGGVSWQPASALALTTNDITEATNLYYTDERVDDRVSSLIQNGIGINWSYDDPSNTLTGNVTLAPFSTDDLSEGSNLYYTNERVDDRVSVLIQDNTGISWTYLDGSGTLTPTINISDFTTDDLPQGTTNLYFTNEAIDDRVSALIQNGTGINWTYNDPLNTLTGNVTLAPFSTDDLSEGSNLYYTNERVDDRMSSLIQDSATITWSYNDTLNTLTANAITTNMVNISKNGSSIGSQPEINFIEGSDISLSIINDGANNRINVTVSGTAVTGQPGTVTTIANDGIQVGDSDITSIEFSSKFNVVEILDTFVQVDIDMSLEELNNVSNVSPLLDWDVLKYNSSLGIWENGNLSEILSLDQLSDVQLASPQTGDGIIYNSITGQWENSHIAQSLSELDDISISSPAQSGDILMYNASLGIWENIEGVISSLLDVSSATPTDLQALKYNALSGLWQPFDSLYRIEQDSATVKDHFTTLNFKGAINVSTGFTPEIIDVSLDASTLSISDLGDINLVSPILDGDSLIYNSTLGVWEAGSPSVGITQVQIDGVVQNISTPTLNFNSSDFSIIESPADVFELSINDSGINHDSTFGFVVNEHVDHSTVFLVAGDGLSGGGDLTSSRTLNLDIPGLDPLSDASLASNDTLIAYNTSADAHEEVTIAQLSSAVGESLGINPINGVIYTSSNWTDNVDGTITLPTVDAVLYDDQNWNGTAARFTIIGGTTGTGLTALTDEATNYIYIDYNLGSPQWVITTSEPDYNRSDRAKYITLYRAGNFLHVLDWGFEGSGLSNKLLQRVYETNKFQRASGLAISTGGNDDLQVNIDAGDVWNGVHREITPSINSWDNTFFSNYHTAGAWDRTVIGLGAGTANNTHYDNGTDLVALGNGKRVVNWYYKGVESGSHVYEVIGRGQYGSVADAQLETVPPVPELVSSHAILVGRIICREGVSTPLTVESAFETQFTATEVTSHNDLSGIQGGIGGEYFHLTNAQHTYLTTNTFLEGAGTNNYVARWTPSGILLGDSLIQDNGTSLSIGNTPNNISILDIDTTLQGPFITSTKINTAGNQAAYGLTSTSSGINSLGDNIGVAGFANGNSNRAIGIVGNATNSVGNVNIGGYFTAANGVSNYSVQLLDGTQTVGGGKFLKDTGDGKANWAQITASDVSGAVGGAGVSNQVAYFTATDTISSDPIFLFNGLTIGINSLNPSSWLNIEGSTLSNGIRSINTSTAGTARGALFSAQGVNANSNFGIQASAQGSTSENIAGLFSASGTNPYAIQLVDGSEGVGKVLTSDASGKATWQTPASGVGGSGLVNKVALWTSSNTISYDDGITWGTISGNPTLGILGSSGTLPSFSVANGTISQAVNGYSQLTLGSFTSSNQYPIITLTRSFGTRASNLDVPSGNILGALRWQSQLAGSSSVIQSLSTENHTTGSSGGNLQFQTTPNGSTTPSTRMEIGNDGGIGIGAASNLSYKLNVESSSGTIGIRSNVTNNGTGAIWGISSGAGVNANTGLTGFALGSSVLNTGVTGQATTASAGDNIGGRFTAGSATNNYSVHLQDGTQTVGGGKFLRDMGDGKANWAQITASDVSGAVGGSGTLNYIPKWTPNGSTLGDSLIQDNGTATSINETLSNSSSLGVGTGGLSTSTKWAIKGRSINSSTGTNFGVEGVAASGTTSNIGGNFLADVTSTNFAIGASVGSTGIGVTIAGTALDGVNATSLGLSSVIKANTFNPGNSIGGFYQVAIASANDNIGILVKTSNSGAGNAYALALQDGTQGAGKVLTSDAEGRGTWQTPTGGVGGSGTNNYVARWTPNGSTLGDSIIEDDGSTIAINSSLSATSQLQIGSSLGTTINVLNANTGSFAYGIRVGQTGAGTDVFGIQSTSSGGTSSSTGIRGVSNGAGVTGTGVIGLATGTALNNVGGYFKAENGTVSNYAIKVEDSTVGIGKVLTDMTGNGDASWANITESDITDLGTYALVGSYTNNYVTKWNATTNTLEESLIRDDGNNVAIGAAPNAARALYVQTSSDIYAIAGQNASTSGLAVGTQGVSVNPSSTEVSYGVAGSAGTGSITKPSTFGAGDLVGVSGSASDSSTAGKLIGALGSVQSSSTASGDTYGIYSFVSASTAVNAYAIGIHLNSNANPTHNLGIIEEANTGFYSDTDFVMIDAGGVFNFSNINNLTADSTPDPSADYVMTWDDSASAHKKVLVSDLIPYDMPFACGDESTAITVANDLVTLRAPRAFTITNVKASLTTAGSTSGVTTIDVKVNGVSIFSTLLTIDAGETTSVSAAVSAVLSTTSIADDAEITVDVTTVSGGGTEAGLKVYLIGNLA